MIHEIACSLNKVDVCYLIRWTDWRQQCGPLLDCAWMYSFIDSEQVELANITYGMKMKSSSRCNDLRTDHQMIGYRTPKL